jgi:transcriptional regulator with XRE-family HTH domain
MFSEQLKIARKQKSLSQAALGKLLGVQAQTIGRWETGKSEPNLETINKLCEALDVPLRYFINEERVDYQLTLEEAFVINKYRELNDDGKQMIINLLNMI